MLAPQMEAEIAVIGAGYAGLTAALELAKAGRDVVLVDAGAIGEGNPSANSGGHVNYDWSFPLENIEKSCGLSYARELFRYAVAGIQRVEDYVEKYQMADASFRRGSVYLARNENDMARLSKRHKLFERYSGAQGRESLMVREQIEEFVRSPEFVGGLYSGYCGQIEPPAYLHGLARAARNHGARLLENTKIVKIEEKSSSIVLETDTGQEIKAGRVVISGGTAFLRQGLYPSMRRWQATAGTAAIKTDPLPPEVIERIFPGETKPAYADLETLSTVMYGRLDSKNRMDFGAYVFLTGQDADYAPVEALMYRTFPILRERGVKVQGRRFGILSGTRTGRVQFYQAAKGNAKPIETYDSKKRILIVSGFGGEGINLGTSAGYAAAAALNDHPAELEFLARIKHKKLPFSFASEAMNTNRDGVFVKALQFADRHADKKGLKGAVARVIARHV